MEDAVSLTELEAQITELAGQLNAASHRWLVLIAEFDRREGWADGRLPSCAHWLNFKCGLNLGAAREQGPALPVATVRRLACDATLLRVVETEQGEPLAIGRKSRSIPPAIRRALNARDAGCRFPGCTHRRYVDAHHVEHWADGGETTLANLVTLCRTHHRLVHEGGITLSTGPDGRLFARPDGRSFDPAYREETAACRWTGEPMDYDMGVAVLCSQVERAEVSRRVSAETST